MNYFQQWALLYWLYLDRRTTIEDRRSELETQTFNLFPERWAQLYQDKSMMGLIDGEEAGEEPVTDIDALDQWYEEMVKNGGLQKVSGQFAEDDEWGDWT